MSGNKINGLIPNNLALARMGSEVMAEESRNYREEYLRKMKYARSLTRPLLRRQHPSGSQQEQLAERRNSIHARGAGHAD